MNKYAMILLNRCIDLIESETIPEYPPDEDGNIVKAIECDDGVKIGMSYDEKRGFYLKAAEKQSREPDAVTEIRIALMEIKTTEEYNSCLLEIANA